VAKGIVIQIVGDGSSADKALELVQKRLEETAEKAKHESGEIAEAMEKVTHAFESVGIYLGVHEAVDAIKELVAGSLELGETLLKTSQRTGLTVETLSVLHYAAAITGEDFESLASAVSKMDKTIGQATEGNKTAQAFLQKLGLNAKELAGRSDGAEIAFKKFAQTLAATENPIRRVELATGLLGKSGAAMIPLITEVGENWDAFKKKAEDAGVLLNGETAEAMAVTNQRLEDLKQHILGAAVALSEGLSPGLSKMLDVIASGKGDMNLMQEWGQMIAHTFEYATSAAYGLASAFYTLASVGDLGKLTERGREELHKAEELSYKAEAMRDLAQGGDDWAAKPFLPATEGAGTPHGGFEGVGDLTQPKKTPSDDSVAKGAVALAEAQAKAEAAAVKSGNEAIIAELDAQHKLMLVGDEEFYREKLIFLNSNLDAEETAIRKEMADVQALHNKQAGEARTAKDPASRNRASSGAEASAAKLVELNQQINELVSKRHVLDSEYGAGQEERAAAEKLTTLKLAAQIEEQTNGSISARIELMRYENSLAVQKAQINGQPGQVAELQQLERTQEAKLQIEQLDRQIVALEEQNRDAVEATNKRVTDGVESKRAATAQINQLNRDDAQQLQVLVAQYDALAKILGGEFTQNATQLHAKLDAMNTQINPNKQQNAELVKTLGSAFESMADQITSASLKGGKAFHQMSQQIEEDILRLAVKLAMQKWITPALTGLFSGGGGGAASSGTDDLTPILGFAGGGEPPTDAPSLIGEKGPELFFPKGPGTVVPSDVVSKMAQGAGGGAANVSVNVINNSSQPVTARPGPTSFDPDMKSYVVHTILEDMAQGGPIAQGMQGFGQN
jgi:hypothetical protein